MQHEPVILGEEPNRIGVAPFLPNDDAPTVRVWIDGVDQFVALSPDVAADLAVLLAQAVTATRQFADPESAFRQKLQAAGKSRR